MNYSNFKARGIVSLMTMLVLASLPYGVQASQLTEVDMEPVTVDFIRAVDGGGLLGWDIRENELQVWSLPPYVAGRLDASVVIDGDLAPLRFAARRSLEANYNVLVPILVLLTISQEPERVVSVLSFETGPSIQLQSYYIFGSDSLNTVDLSVSAIVDGQEFNTGMQCRDTYSLWKSVLMPDVYFPNTDQRSRMLSELGGLTITDMVNYCRTRLVHYIVLQHYFDAMLAKASSGVNSISALDVISSGDFEIEVEFPQIELHSTAIDGGRCTASCRKGLISTSFRYST